MYIARTVALAAAVTAGALAGLVTAALDAAPTFAHVTVKADNPQAGARDVRVTFTSRPESRQAGLASERVILPDGLSPRDLRPVSAPAGWTFSASADGFTTSGPALRPGVDATFAVMIAHLPSNATTLTFTTVETYSDGTTSRWVDNQAPVLTLKPVATSAATSPAIPSPAATATVRGDGRPLGVRLALISIAVLAVAVTGAVITFAMVQLRRRP